MQTFLSGSAVNSTSPVVFVSEKYRGSARTVQVQITAVATVSIQGRLGPAFPWWVLATDITASAYSLIQPTPEMRVVVSGNTGSVSVGIDAD